MAKVETETQIMVCLLLKRRVLVKKGKGVVCKS